MIGTSCQNYATMCALLVIKNVCLVDNCVLLMSAHDPSIFFFLGRFVKSRQAQRCPSTPAECIFSDTRIARKLFPDVGFSP